MSDYSVTRGVYGEFNKSKPNGCTKTGGGHGTEIITIGKDTHCLRCTFDAVQKVSAEKFPKWFFTGSPYGKEIAQAIADGH